MTSGMKQHIAHGRNAEQSVPDIHPFWASALGERLISAGRRSSIAGHPQC